MKMTFFTGRADIISLAYSNRLVNTVGLIAQNHISDIFYVSKTILYSKFSIDIQFLEQYFQHRILSEALIGTAILDWLINHTLLTTQ